VPNSGPQALGEDELRIRRLPEQEVADPHFAAGADEEVGIGRVAERHVAVERRLVEVLGLDAADHRLPARLDDVPAAAVVEGDRQVDPGVVAGAVLGVLPGLAQLVRDLGAVADDADANAVAGELGEVLRDGDEDQAHQAGDLFARPLPVLGREREHGQVLDAAIGAGVDGAHERIDALLVAEEARHVPLLGPAAVAVHDDGDVARHGRRRDGTLAIRPP
jgi:hypothetical protein